MPNENCSVPLLTNPFRIFFLCCSCYAICIITAWSAMLHGGLHLPIAWLPSYWHSHEMIFGFITASIAGFLLTAVCNWTGEKPITGSRLMVLACVWAAGRIVMWIGALLNPGVVALIDMAFLITISVYFAIILLRHDNKRNFVLAGVLFFLAVCNLLMHFGAYTNSMYWIWAGETSALGLITMIMVIIAGRIIPLFTKNALRNQGFDIEKIKSSSLLDILAVAGTGLLIPLNFLTEHAAIVGTVTLLVAIINTLRFSQWAGLATRRDPLLWILHLGYLWIILALLLKAITLLGIKMSPSVWQHALGVGAISTLIVGMMTRVALGHTGRTLRLPFFGLTIYIAITLAVIFRLLMALNWMSYSTGLTLTTLFWVMSFASYLYFYLPILTKPRL